MSEPIDIDLAAVMEHARTNYLGVPDVIEALSNFVGTTKGDIAQAFKLSRQTAGNRLKGYTQIQPWEITGFAAFFNVPEDIIRKGDPRAARKWASDHPEAIRKSPADAMVTARRTASRDRREQAWERRKEAARLVRLNGGAATPAAASRSPRAGSGSSPRRSGWTVEGAGRAEPAAA